MLQRMNAGASRKKGRSSHSGSRSQRYVRESYDTQIDYSYITSVEPPIVGKVDHHSIEMSWANLNEEDVHGDSRLKYELQQENSSKTDYDTVYIGYADNCKVDGLSPLRAYKFRLIVSANDQQLATSSVISVATLKEPYGSIQLHKAVIKNSCEMVAKIHASGQVSLDTFDKFGLTPLMVATQKGNNKVFDLLLELGANPDIVESSGKTCLMIASFHGNRYIAEKLREAGLEWDDCDRNGSTALHYAIDSASPSFVKWALEDGADIYKTDQTSGWTPLLRCAATNGNHEVAEILLEAGADPNKQDLSGKSPLMMACLNGHLVLTKLLLDSGANINLKSSHGKTCMDMASSFDRQAIVTCLETALSQ